MLFFLCMFLCVSPQPHGTYSFQFPSESFMFHYLKLEKKKQIDKQGIGIGHLFDSEVVLCAPTE